MTILNVFNGGFLKPLNLSNSSVSSSTPSDQANVYRISDQHVGFNSRLRPAITSSGNNSKINDYVGLEVCWDQTTRTLPGKPGFIEPPPDDYHPMPEIEYTEEGGSAARYVKTPHFIVKPDSTSQYVGKDRYDNFMYEVLSNFGRQFNWYDGGSSLTTFNGGDLCSTPNGLHLSFMYMKSKDCTSYTGDLYHSKFVDSDGTFGNPFLVERNIDVAGYGTPSALYPIINRKTNPKMLYVPKLGLLLSSLRSSNIGDTTNYFIDLKLSRDDGTTWSSYNRFPIEFYTKEKLPSGAFLPVNDFYCPYLHWAYAENKIVCLIEFRDARTGTTINTSHMNLVFSEDNGRSFKKINVDLANIADNLGNTDVKTYSIGSIYYDNKISKFAIVMAMYGKRGIMGMPESYGLLLLTNKDGFMYDWNVSITENLGDYPIFNKSTKPWNFYFNNGPNLLTHGPNFVTYVDENNISWVVMNGGMSYKGSRDGSFTAFDDYADYTGFNYSVPPNTFAWIPNPMLVPIELVPATDDVLGQFTYANTPWRARKFSPGNVGHKNIGDDAGITPGNGCSLSVFSDGILLGNERIRNQEEIAANGEISYPQPTFYIQSITKYKNQFWMLGTDSVAHTFQENRRIEYQIPTIIHHRGWSNLNIKPRAQYHLVPGRNYDSTYVGWTTNNVDALQQIKTEFPPQIELFGHYNRYWEIKFARSDAAQSGSTTCGLEHLGNTSDDAKFRGQRGCAWDSDSTRGVFAHFGCSLDSKFKSDITSMVHFLSVGQNPQENTNKSILQTFLGRDHIAFRSSGNVANEQYVTCWADTTRDMEFLVMNHRYKNIDTSHIHKAFFKYRESSDWTMMYENVCDVGAAFSSYVGIRLGNLWRWPATITATDKTNAVYFKFHDEGWSVYGMDNISTAQDDNKTWVLPQPCTHATTYLPNNLGISWAGQDATCAGQFRIESTLAKNSPIKVFDGRPNTMWKTLDGTGTPRLLIDFGKELQFDSIALYNHNILKAVFSHGIASNDMTNFLVHSTYHTGVFDSTDYRNKYAFGYFNQGTRNVSVVDTKTLLVYDKKFLTFAKELGLKDRVLLFYMERYESWYPRKCVYSKILNDSSVYCQFENPNSDLWITGSKDVVFDEEDFVENVVYVLPDRNMYILPNKINARYVEMDLASANEEFNSQFTSNQQPNFDGYFSLGMLSFGLFQASENPIQKGMRTTLLSPTILDKKIFGAPVTVTTGTARKRFEIQMSSAKLGRDKQFEQVEALIKSVGVNRDSFFFIPRNFVVASGGFDPVYLFKSKINDFYLVRISGNPTYRKNGCGVDMTLILEEVI